MQIINKYAKPCRVCKIRVEEGEGFAHKGSSGYWDTYCREHAPERISGMARKLHANGEIEMPYEAASLPLVKSLPGARWNPQNKRWSVSTALGDRRRILEVAERLKLEVDPDFQLPDIEQVESPALKRAKAVGKLYPYQLEGVEWLSNRRKALLGDEMGLGKSLEVIMALEDDSRVLLVVPASLKHNWRQEFQKWRPAFNVTILEGRDSFKVPEPGEAVVVNTEILPDWLEPLKPGVLTKEELKEQISQIESDFDSKIQERPEDKWYLDGQKKSKIRALEQEQKAKKKARLQPISRVPREIAKSLETVVFVQDECHRSKNYRAARTAKVSHLSQLCGKVWFLTGTPLLNRPTDLYGILQSGNMAREVFGGNTWNRFVELFNGYKEYHGGYVFGSPDPMVPELLRRVMLRRRREDVLPDLPKKTYTTFTVGEISNSLQKKMDKYWDENRDFLEVAEELPPFEEFSAIRAELAKDRVDAVIDYVQDHEEQEVPLVVFSAHRAPIDALKNREGWEVIYGGTPNAERQRIVNDFQSGKLKGIAGTITAMGVGLTLTHAWKMLFVDLDWTPALNSQAEDRCARIGQESSRVEIVRMVTSHPLEQHVHNLLSEKIALIQASVEDKIEVSVPQSPSIQNESEEEYEARQRELRRLREEQEKSLEGVKDQKARRAKEKAGEILERERAKASLPEVELTEEKIQEVREAFSYMLSVCDGAFSRDGQGFNKPDAAVAKFLSLTGLETETELRAAERMLSRYHRQLAGSFPRLFGKGKKVEV